MNPQQPFYGQSSGRPNSNTNSPIPGQNPFANNAGGSSPNMSFGSPHLQQLTDFHRTQHVGQGGSPSQMLMNQGVTPTPQMMMGQGGVSPQMMSAQGFSLQQLQNAQTQQQRTGSPQLQGNVPRPGMQRTPSQQVLQQMTQLYQQQQQQRPQVQSQPRPTQQPQRPAAQSGQGNPINISPAIIQAAMSNPQLVQQLTPQQRQILMRALAAQTASRNQQQQPAQQQQQRPGQLPPNTIGIPQGISSASATPPQAKGSPQMPYQPFGQTGQINPNQLSQLQAAQSQNNSTRLPTDINPASVSMSTANPQQLQNRPPLTLNAAALQAAQAARSAAQQGKAGPTGTSATTGTTPSDAAAPSTPALKSNDNANEPKSTSDSSTFTAPPASSDKDASDRRPSIPITQAFSPAPGSVSTSKPSTPGDSTAPTPKPAASKRKTKEPGEKVGRPRKKQSASETAPQPRVYFASAEQPTPATKEATTASERPAAPRERERPTEGHERRRGTEGIRGTMRNEIAKLMYAAGDVPEPDGDSVDMMEDIVADFLADLCRPVPPMRATVGAVHQPITLTTGIVRHRLASHPSMRKYLERFDIMNHLAGELAKNKRIFQSNETHNDLVETVGKDYLGIDDTSGGGGGGLQNKRRGIGGGSVGTKTKKKVKREPGEPPGERKKPGPKKGWKQAQKEAIARGEEIPPPRKNWRKTGSNANAGPSGNKHRGVSVSGHGRTSASPAFGS